MRLILKVIHVFLVLSLISQTAAFAHTVKGMPHGEMMDHSTHMMRDVDPPSMKQSVQSNNSIGDCCDSAACALALLSKPQEARSGFKAVEISSLVFIYSEIYPSIHLPPPRLS
ncbi:MAG: hypothetical protein OEX00_04655 [Gammaproteobacteria bacterium]|nr:hypothetical protein [Gammaproteobacteria bacterium]MDH5694384.1 hypothetical protein [Gammaproteobacteria bacterium]